MKLTKEILVIDLEATCWEGNPPPGEEQEIIEVGICHIDPARLEKISSEGILIRPVRSRVSEFCTRLTTLKPEDIESGLSFPDACEFMIKKYSPRHKIWASYGEFDKKLFQKEIERNSISQVFSERHINVKTLSAIALGLDEEVGMEKSLKGFGLELKGIHHRGVDDASNIASILLEIIKRMRKAK